MSHRQVIAALFATAALAGCASAATSASETASGVANQPALGAPAAAVAKGTTGFAAGQPGGGLASTIIVGTPPSADIERSVTAAYTVPPGSFLTSFEGVIARAVGLGGYVASSTTQPDSHGRIVSGAVTLKIPAASIAAFLNAMPSTFTASSINFSAIDHTAQFVDVNARLASAHAHLAALNALLAKATSIGDITNLEQEIEAVQIEVDTDQGQLNVLTASVELATASIQLTERGISLVVVAPPNPVAGGLSGGWKNAVQVTGAALEGVVSALPLLVIAVIGLLVWRRQSRGPIARRTPGATE
jgi:Domain of unknown function (DUF4349)